MSPRCLLWVMQPYVFTRCARVCHLSIGCRFSNSWTRKSTSRFAVVVKMILTCWEMLILNQLSHQNPALLHSTYLLQNRTQILLQRSQRPWGKASTRCRLFRLVSVSELEQTFRHKIVRPTSFRNSSLRMLLADLLDVSLTWVGPNLSTIMFQVHWEARIPAGYTTTHLKDINALYLKAEMSAW